MTPTETPLDTTFDDFAGVGAADPSVWGEGYEDAAAPQRRITPVPGQYILRMPESITLEHFKPTKDKTGIEILLRPLVIVAGPLQGVQLTDAELAAVNGMQYPLSAYVSTKQKKGSKASDAGAVLRNFGTPSAEVAEMHLLRDRELAQAWFTAFESLAGQTTPNPVYLDWEGKDKETLDNGYPRRYRGMGPGKGAYRFDTPNGEGGFESWKEVDRPDPKDATRKARIYANLVLGYLGFSPRT